ncbi:hypothetical protein Tco_0077999 [Tanacetum coccineum]
MCPHQSPREKVGSNDMFHNYYLEKANKNAQLQKDLRCNGKHSMIELLRLPNTANGCKPKPRNWQASMSSRVSNKDVHLGKHRKQKPFLKFNELANVPTCKKCLYSANHDKCVSEKPLKIPTEHRFFNKKTTTVPEKTSESRSLYLRWKCYQPSTGKVDSKPTHVSIVVIRHIHASKQTLGLSAADQASVFMAMTFEQRSSSLVLHQMTSDHNRSELGIHDHSNELSSSKLVPKVVPLAVKTATSRQDFGITFHTIYQC